MHRVLIVLAATAIPAWALAQNIRPASNSGSAQLPASTPGIATITNCTVSTLPNGQADVPAQEAGQLMEITVRENQEVKTGELLAKIEDVLVQKQLKNVQAEYKAAHEKASGDIDIRHAKAAAETAKFEYQRSKEAVTGTAGRQGVAGAISEVELKRLYFQWERAILAIEQAAKQQLVDGYTAEAKLAETEIAQEQINRRKIMAPIDGEVKEIIPHPGEWVKPGDPVLRLIRLDRLRVDGYVKFNEHSPGDVRGKPIKVRVELTGGKSEQFDGRIVAVDSDIRLGNQYKVSAEVENRKDRANEWMLRPGLRATMDIQLR